MNARHFVQLLVIAILLAPSLDLSANNPQSPLEVVVMSEQDALRLNTAPGFYFAPFVGNRATPFAKTSNDLLIYIKRSNLGKVFLRGPDAQSETLSSKTIEAATALTRIGIRTYIGSRKGNRWDYNAIFALR